MLDKVTPQKAAIPFDTARLDRLMDEAGIDVLIASSKHNVQYLLGGHRAFFFETMDAMGLTRYLPVLVYAKGAPDKAAYFGHRLENFQRENNPFWTPVQQCNSSGSVDTMQKAIDHIKKTGIQTKGIGAELGFLPVDAGKALQGAFAGSKIDEALFVLERMRAIKTPDELKKLKIASEAVIDSMKAVIANHGPGTTKAELTEALRREETNRGLTFDYCLITAGTSLNRAPSPAVWGKGDILSLDFGGNYHGYIGDICRMAIHGEPDAELEDMLGDIEEIQRAAFKPVKAGAKGSEMYRVGRGAAVEIQVPQQPSLPRPRHGSGQPRGAAADVVRPGALRRLRRASAARDRHGDLGRDHDAAPQARLHQARGHGRGHRRGLRHLRRGCARLEFAAAPPHKHEGVSVELQACGPDHRRPLCGFIDDEFRKVRGRHR